MTMAPRKNKVWTESEDGFINERTSLLHPSPHHVTTATSSSSLSSSSTSSEDFGWLLRKGSSIAGTIFIHQMMEMTNISLIGQLGSRELAGVTLANMLLAVVYFCITTGISNTLETLCSQAYTGAKDKTRVGVYFQRVYFVLILWSIFVGIILYNGTFILITMGQDPELAGYAGSYLRCIFPSAIVYMTFDAHRKYLQVQGATLVPVIILVIGVFLNALIQYFLIFYMKMGFMGAPLGLSIVYCFMLGGQLFYTHFIRQETRDQCCWGGWDLRQNILNTQMDEWVQFFQLALSNVFVICSEYYVVELSVLAISYLPNSTSNDSNATTTILAAGSVLLRSHLCSHTVAMGLGAASATRVGHYIGQGSAQGARQSFHMGCWVSLLFALPLSVFFWVFREPFPYLFTQESEVAQLISIGMPLLASFQIFGMIAGQLSGVLRGLGRQQVSAFISIIAFYGVTVPLGYTLIFLTPYWSLNGVWVAFGIGYVIYALAQLLYLLTVHWSSECAKVQHQLYLLYDNDEDNNNTIIIPFRKD